MPGSVCDRIAALEKGFQRLERLPGPTGPQGPTGPEGPEGEPCSFVTARVAADGSLISATSGVSVVHLETGMYRVTIPAQTNQNYPIILTPKAQIGFDDVGVSYLSVTATTFDVCIRRQDNGSAPGTLVDGEFSMYVPQI